MLRTQLYADPTNLYLHNVILDSCRKFPQKLALLDTSINRRFTYAEYGEIVERVAHGLISAGLKPGEIVAIFLPNSWEFAATYHATTLAGAIPTLLNPSYREREVRYQLENSGAAFLITDAATLGDINLGGLPNLRRVFSTRQPASLNVFTVAWPMPRLAPVSNRTRCLSAMDPSVPVQLPGQPHAAIAKHADIFI